MNDLFKKTDRESQMKQWDYWRGELINGFRGSAARDWFESVLDYYDEHQQKDDYKSSQTEK